MNKIITYILGLLSFTSKGQSNLTMTDNNLNIQFDRVILTDTIYKVIKTQDFPISDIKPKKQAEKLKYYSDLRLWDNNLKEILDNPLYSEQ